MVHQEQSAILPLSLCALNFKKLSSFATIYHSSKKVWKPLKTKKDTTVLRSHHKNNLCRQAIPK